MPERNPPFPKRLTGRFRNWTLFALLLAFAAAVPARSPLPLEESPELLRRVITLPNARVYREPALGAEVVTDSVAVFDVYYVFGEKQADDMTWLEVGKAVTAPTAGWIPQRFTQTWNLMLVLQYAAPGQREPVLFFEDVEALRDVVLSPSAPREAKTLIDKAQTGGHQESGLIAIEETQAGYVSFEHSPYLLPILDTQRDEFDDGTRTTLVEVASINASQNGTAVSTNADAIAVARRAVVFVIDTTVSMGPYIEQALQTARRIHQEFGRRGLLDHTSFGLVGYRNNMDAEPQRSGLEYVSRVFVDLDPSAPSDALLHGLEAMTAAKVSTHSWDEDAVAGLHDAVWGMNWKPFDELRLVVLITDAGALRGNDPKSRHHDDGLGLFNVRQKAILENVVILPIHMLTPEAEQAGNSKSARRQYKRLGVTGDTNVGKYTPVPTGSVTVFQRQMDSLATALGEVTERAQRGVPESKPQLDTLEGTFSLGSLFQNEVFSAQQRYLGDTHGAEAEVFYRAWAADRDLTEPRRSVFTVNVFLTRNQLSELAKSLDGLLDNARRAETRPDTFFARLRALAVATSTDPNRYGAGFSTLADSDLVPSFLKLLPYRSDVLRLSEDNWLDRGPTGQALLVSELERKLRTYHDIYQDQRKWKDLGAGDPGLDVYPVPLDVLP